MKKIISILVAFASTFSLAFAEGTEISFSNKIYEEDVIAEHKSKDYSDDGKASTKTDFPAIKNKMEVEITSEKVDALVAAIVAIDDYDEKHFGVTGKIDDWYIEFRPIHPITLGMHTSIYADGSYLPVYDDNIGAGDIGSSGFTMTYRPSALKDALRISFTVPFEFDGDDVNWLNGKKETLDGDGEPYENEKLKFGLGAIYNHDFFNIGVAVQNVVDEKYDTVNKDGDSRHQYWRRQLGVYAALPTLFGNVEGLTIGGGIAKTWADTDKGEDREVAFDDLTEYGGIDYETLVNGFLTYETDAFTLSAEALYNCGTDTELQIGDPLLVWDFYSAASLSFTIAEKLTATVTGKVLMDLKGNEANKAFLSGKDKAENAYGAGFALEYEVNDNNTVGAEFDIDTFDGNWKIKAPVYWEYHF